MPNPSWLSPLVWTDYRLAFLLLVIVPLTLSVWAFVRQAEALQKLLVIYWRVSSLLAITVYLLIGAIPIGFLTGWLARILIPLSLWYWADLNEEINEQSQKSLKLAFHAWRWAVSLYSAIGVIAQIPVLRCGLANTDQVVSQAFCRVWLEAPWAFREMIHGGARPYFLGFLGIVALVIYGLCFGYFVLFKLPKQKRSALG